MGEVCEMFDLPASTIRFWEKSFTELRPKKNAKGNRLFTSEDIDNLKIIYHLVKERGMTLAGAQKFLKDRRTALKKEMTVVELLQNIRATLVNIKQELETLEKQAANEIIIKNEQIDVQESEPIEEKSEKPRYIELLLFE